MDKKLAELLAKHDLLDDNCREIFTTLLGYGNLRHNELMRKIQQFDVKMTRPTLDTHLKHLLESGLVVCKTDFQISEYALTKEIYEFLKPLSQEKIKKWLDLGYDESLPKHLRIVKFDRKEYFEKLTDEQLDRIVSDDINSALGRGLYELKNFIGYDLNLNKFESYTAFWKLAGNPIYRMYEKSLVEKCRDSKKYKEMLFKKIDLLIESIKSHRELAGKKA